MLHPALDDNIAKFRALLYHVSLLFHATAGTCEINIWKLEPIVLMLPRKSLFHKMYPTECSELLN